MKKINKTEILKQIIRDTFWMARRYAHGRHTYAPGMIRDAYKMLKKYFPELVPFRDIVIEETRRTTTDNLTGDYLDDCNE